MGNFQLLAEQVLIKNTLNINIVSSFHPLAKKTGNFDSIKGNIGRNLNQTNGNKDQGLPDIQLETNEEISTKQISMSKETFVEENKNNSFLNSGNVDDILICFFDDVEHIGIQLLPNDKRWIKSICFGLESSFLKILLEEYINCWIKAMTKESSQLKKQNKGRFAANTFIREELTNDR